MAILSILLTVIIVVVSILMVLIVLIQRPKQEGLGAAFGGGSLDSALGAHTSDVLQKFTTWLGILFFVSAIGLAMIKTREFRDTTDQNLLEEVDAKKPQSPALPPELMNIPGLEGLSVEPGNAAETTPATPAPATPAPTPPATGAPKAINTPAPAAPVPTPAPAAKGKTKGE